MTAVAQTNVPNLGGYRAKQRVAIAAEGANAAAPVQIIKAAKPASVLALLGMPAAHHNMLVQTSCVISLEMHGLMSATTRQICTVSV